MAVAADIDEAIAFAAENVIGKEATLTAAFASWIVIFTDQLPAPGPPFDPSNLDQRSVRDWYGPNLIVQREIDLTDFGTRLLSVSKSIDVVSRTLFAVKFATIGVRITAGQESSVVTQYNTAWA